jgi:hypothetical protein
MILQSNTSHNMTRITYEMRCCNIMRSQWTGVGQFTMTLHWIGTIINALVTFPCPVTSQMSYINSNTTRPELLSTRHPDTLHRSLVQKCNMQPNMRHLPSQTQSAPPSKKSLAPSYTTLGRLIQHCLCPSIT